MATRGRKKREERVTTLYIDERWIIESDPMTVILSQNDGTGKAKLNTQRYYPTVSQCIREISKNELHRTKFENLAERFDAVLAQAEAIAKTVDKKLTLRCSEEGE